MTGRQVAFFRNMNLGQARSHSPTRPVLEGAFTAAGAVGVRSFQSNGTVLFDPRRDPPTRMIERVRGLLAEQVGYTDIAPTQPLVAVATLVLAARERVSGSTADVFATFFEPVADTQGAGSPGGSASDPDAAWAPGHVLDAFGTTVVASGPGWVVTRVLPGGDPTTAVQVTLGRKATTRVLRTVERLVRAAGVG